MKYKKGTMMLICEINLMVANHSKFRKNPEKAYIESL